MDLHGYGFGQSMRQQSSQKNSLSAGNTLDTSDLKSEVTEAFQSSQNSEVPENKSERDDSTQKTENETEKVTQFYPNQKLRILTAERAGFRCPYCDYNQDAFDKIANHMWKFNDSNSTKKQCSGKTSTIIEHKKQMSQKHREKICIKEILQDDNEANEEEEPMTIRAKMTITIYTTIVIRNIGDRGLHSNKRIKTKARISPVQHSVDKPLSPKNLLDQFENSAKPISPKNDYLRKIAELNAEIKKQETIVQSLKQEKENLIQKLEQKENDIRNLHKQKQQEKVSNQAKATMHSKANQLTNN
ncbi:viral A-type inclusion protein [Reticulomyxa filosa]|uniref:Viral A-type inclusion protein n=1 Tax=Reticulomyxa filosa TaxID=46433 RepID=X6M5H6_RETFI|nr:viral A-type inclusion protein [Reticulomyxa filosa]|eukprot:ETO09243.1 viral A-type inclusion protein [Reticulomyxa filosa]